MKKIQFGSYRPRTTKRSIALLMAGAILALLSAGSQARADDSVGTVTQVTGSAQIQRASGTLAAQQGRR